MTLQRRSFTSLPPYLQTNRNNLELAVTDDVLYEPEQAAFVSGFIGDTSKLTAEDLRRTPLLVENSAIQQKYQFTIGVAQKDPISGKFVSGAFYDDVLNHLALNGAIIDDPNKLFSCGYYAWSPPISYDKLVNPARYYWTGDDDAVQADYITKEPAGSQTTLYQFDGSQMNKLSVTIVDGLPGSGTTDEVVEDISTTDRLFYKWNGSAWIEIAFQIAADVPNSSTFNVLYFSGDYVYVCRTGPDFNRLIVWVYRTPVGRWISVPVVISIDEPDTPTTGMLWEDATVPPARILRVYDGTQWQVLTYTVDAGPSGVPDSQTYSFDLRDLSSVDTWSATNWWRALSDLSVTDRSVLVDGSQGARPIIEFWGNIEPAVGDARTARNQNPLFNVYAVSPDTFEVVTVDTTNFPTLDSGAQETSTIFNYVRLLGGIVDPVLGFAIQYGTDGTPEFYLDLERKTITVAGDPLAGYRFYRDTATGYVHCIWEKAGGQLVQIADANGLYSVPKNLQSNADHEVVDDVSRATYLTHFAAVMSAQTGFSGTPYGTNSFRYTDQDLTLGASMIDPEESLIRLMAVLQTNKLDLPDAIRQMSREYNRVMVKFANQLTMFWNNGTISTTTDQLAVSAAQACDIVLTQIFTGRNSEFPFYLSVMGTYTATEIVNGSPIVYDTAPRPIFIPNSAALIGASPAYVPEKFTDVDGVLKIRGHDGSLIAAFGDARDDVVLELENRFYDAVPDYMKLETQDFSAQFSTAFHLDDYYGNFTPALTAGTVVEIVSDYTTIVSPVTNDRLYSIAQQVYATWSGTKWLTISASVNDVFTNEDDDLYYIFNGYYASPIVTWNEPANFDYSQNDFRRVLQREFERWVVLHKYDFITNDDYDANDAFTWNFSSAGIEGNWRGIYRRIYKTMRPHTHPWEVAGYSVEPDWWRTQYVPTSTASDNTPRYANTHQMWADMQQGIVNIGDQPTVINTVAGTVDQVVADYTTIVSPTIGERVYSSDQQLFAEWDGTDWGTSTFLLGSVFLNSADSKYYIYLGPTFVLVAPIPVDLNGELLDPIAAGVVDQSALTLSSLGDDWAYGDGALVEQQFYETYYYSFAVALAGYLMKPALFVDRTWSLYYRQIGATGTNLIWNGPHLVYSGTLTRPRVADVASQLSLDAEGDLVQNAGLNSWIAEYAAIIGFSPDKDFNKAVINCVSALGWKTAGFVNPNRTRIELLSGHEVPNDDLSVVLHQGPSTNEYYQSGIIIVRDIDGFRVFGTDVLNPFFRVDIGAKPTSGGSIETQESFYYGNFLSAATLASSSGGYQVNDVLTVSGGTFVTPATLTVTAVDDGGKVTDFSILDAGEGYSVTPDNPVVCTGGNGSSLKITATWDLTGRVFTTTNLTIPLATSDTATFGVLVNGYRLQDKFVTRNSTTEFTLDSALLFNKGDKITASVVTTTSNPGTQLGSFTVEGVQVTYFQTGTGVLVDYPYGTLFRTLSDVVNMMVGHGRYLLQQGWVFERITNGVLRDWLGAAKTFVLWAVNLSRANNANALLMKDAQFEFSVMGRLARFNSAFGMILGIEDIRNGSYGVVDVNGDPIRAKNLEVVSTGGSIYVASDSTDIFGIRLYTSQIQHCVFFPDTTTFGDVIYEPPLGLFQDAVIVDTYRTTNWTGRMEAPGFLISGGHLFPNWEKQVSDVTRYYDRFNPPDDPILAGMARALYGYQPKPYMDALAADDRSRFNFFRGTRKASGTFQPYRAFARGTTIGTDNVNIAEDWAWKFAKYGDRRIVTVLFNVDEADFVDIFQTIHFNTRASTNYDDDRIIYVPPFAPPTSDDRWVLTPPEEFYASGVPYTFPVKKGTSNVDYDKYIFSAVLVDQSAVAPGVNLFDWNPARDLHEPFALGLVDYKTAYDPARYNNGPAAEAVNGLLWSELQVGSVWWDTSTARYSDYESFLPDYMQTSREWGKLLYYYADIVRVDDVETVTTLDTHTKEPTAHGLSVGDIIVISGADQTDYNGTFTVETVPTTTTFTLTAQSATDTPGTGDIVVQIGKIDCYEWVASPVPPSAWNAYINSQDRGKDGNYTGTVYNADNASYATREIWDVHGKSTTTYYFWVQNNSRVNPVKNMTVIDIAGRLKNPAQYEVPFFAILDPSTMFVFVGEEIVLDDYGIEVSYEWYEMPRHVEWMLFGENDDFAKIPELVTDKLLDSMIGSDVHGNPVPNVTLAPADIYGSCYFPAQTVFRDIPSALDAFTIAVNETLINLDIQTVSDLFTGLSLSDEQTNSTPNGYWTRATYWDNTVDNTVIYDTVVSLAERDFRAGLNLYTLDDIVKVTQSDQADLWDSTTVAAYYQFGGSSLNSATVAAAGLNYQVGDIVTLLGGTFSTAAILTITSVDAGGGVTGFDITEAGSYTITPSNPVQTTGGSGFLFQVTADFSGVSWNVVGIDHHTIAINANIALNADTFRAFFVNLTLTVTRLEGNRIIFAVLFEMLRQNPVCDWFFKTSYIDPHITQPLPQTAYLRPDEATAIFDAILDLKPYRTKIRDHIVTYKIPVEDVNLAISDTTLDRFTLLFDRLACDLHDENAWDTIPWDATVVYPEDEVIDLMFRGTGDQRCFVIPSVVPAEELVVLLNNTLQVPFADYIYDTVNHEVCFNVAPPTGSAVEIIIDGPYEYFADFEWAFRGNGSKDSQILPDTLTGTTVNNVFSNWNGVHQLPVTDFTVQVTSDTEVVYAVTPTSEFEVNGTAFGDVINNIFVVSTHTGNGSTTLFSTTLPNQTIDTVIVSVDGVWQTHGVGFVINNVHDALHSYVSFSVAPETGDEILIYATTYPNLIASRSFVFTGDGSSAQFDIDGLDTPVPPKIFANIDGIQQNIEVGDFVINDTGILFDVAPENGAEVDVFVIWEGLGLRLTPVSSPATIQWDYAYWNYEDLGRQEYDFAALFIGDDATETFTLPIPQVTSLLYNAVIKFYDNGVLTTADDLGLTVNIIKLSTAVVVEFSAPLSSSVYGAVYVARGFFEGLTPDFGYQDPNGVVFVPTPASYQHYFARLITGSYDPASQITGCPTPEERIQTDVEDLFTIVVKTYVEQFTGPSTITLVGQEVTTEFSDVGFPPIQAARFNNSPWASRPTVEAPHGDTLADDYKGSLSVWIRATDLFNMAHDIGPALLSSGHRRALDISGRGFMRRNPTAISRTNPSEITIPNHGLVSGSSVTFTHVIGGCSELQGQTATVTVVDSDNFTIPVDASGFGADYTGPAMVTFVTNTASERNTLRVVFRDTDSQHNSTIFYWNSSETIPTDEWINLLISWDLNHPAGAKVLQVWVNDTEWTSTSDSTYRYDPDSAFKIPYSNNFPPWTVGTPATSRIFVNVPQIAREVLRSRL